MSYSSWRSFNFFNCSPIRDPFSGQADNRLYSDPKLTAICSGRESSTVFFSNSDGVVTEFTEDMQVRLRFKACTSPWVIVRVMYLGGANLLLTIAEKQGEPLSVQLWDLARPSKDGALHVHTSVNVSNGTNTFPLSAFAISTDFSLLGFGYADGTVIIVRGDLLHDRGSRQRVVFSSSSPVTGLAFESDEENGQTTLFVSTVAQVLTVATHGKNNGKADTILEKSQGCAVGCCIYDTQARRLIVARDDEIIYYSSKHRENSFVFSVQKSKVVRFKNYLVIALAGKATDQQESALASFIDSSTARIIVIDSVNKVIAYSGQISGTCRDIFVQWDKINVLGSDGLLYVLSERDLASRLDVIKSRHLYDVAIQMASQAEADHETVIGIEEEYADYLYSEGDLEDAMVHYIKAVDLGHTSRTILRFRDSQHLPNLTLYLEVLHDKGLATKEHTTLLLNSYSKLKDVDKLSKFIEKGSYSGSFDFDTAIKICRQSGYSSLAVYLAQRDGNSDLAVSMMLKNLHDYRGCLEYVQSLDFNDALSILVPHAKFLLSKVPMETTGVLISLFTGKYSPRAIHIKLPEESAILDENSNAGSTEEGQKPGYAAPVLQSYRAFLNYMSSGITGLKKDLIKGDSASSERSSTASIAEGTERSKPTYQPPKPRLIFSSFIDNPCEFVIFLEACLEFYEREGLKGQEMEKVQLTLFELYLSLSHKSQSKDEQAIWRKKAELLAAGAHLDKSSLLLLSHLASVHASELLTEEDLEDRISDRFRRLAARDDIVGAIELLMKEGQNDAELYAVALNYFVSSENVFSQIGEDEFDEVLQTIHRHHLMAPLQVVQSLSVNSVATIGHVRKHLLGIIDAEKTESENNKNLASSYRSETIAKEEKIKKLLSEPSIVQYTLCASCDLSLDLPAVHFICKHSFHQRCLSMMEEDNAECPKCRARDEQVRLIRHGQVELAERHDLFRLSLEESDQQFKTIADFVSRGALSSV